MNGQNREKIKVGAMVNIVLKADQRTGKLTKGIVMKEAEGLNWSLVIQLFFVGTN